MDGETVWIFGMKLKNAGGVNQTYVSVSAQRAEREMNTTFYIALLTGAILGGIIGAGMERRTNKILKMVRRIQQHEPYALLHLSMKYFWPEELDAAKNSGNDRSNQSQGCN